MAWQISERQPVAGSATQGLWLGDKKVMGAQVIGEDRSRLPRKGTVGS